MLAGYYTNLHEGLGILLFGAAVAGIIGLSFWLDTKSGNHPAYHWDGTEWEVVDG